MAELNDSEKNALYERLTRAMIRGLMRSGIEVNIFDPQRPPRQEIGEAPAIVFLDEQGYHIYISKQAASDPACFWAALSHELAHITRGDLVRGMKAWQRYRENLKNGIKCDPPGKYANVAEDALINDDEKCEIFERVLGIKTYNYDRLYEVAKRDSEKYGLPLLIPEDRSFANSLMIESYLERIEAIARQIMEAMKNMENDSSHNQGQKQGQSEEDSLFNISMSKKGGEEQEEQERKGSAYVNVSDNESPPPQKNKRNKGAGSSGGMPERNNQQDMNDAEEDQDASMSQDGRQGEKDRNSNGANRGRESFDGDNQSSEKDSDGRNRSNENSAKNDGQDKNQQNDDGQNLADGEQNRADQKHGNSSDENENKKSKGEAAQNILDDLKKGTIDEHGFDKNADPQKMQEKHQESVLKSRKTVLDELEKEKAELEKEVENAEKSGKSKEEIDKIKKQIEEIEKEKNDIENKYKGGDGTSKKTPTKKAGRGRGQGRESLDDFPKTPVSKPGVLAKILSQLGMGDKNRYGRTYRRDGRASIGGFLVPGNGSQPRKTAAFIVDVSGSMGKEYGKLATLIKEFSRLYNVHIVIHDDGVIYSGKSIPKAPVFTGGGTTFTPAWEEALRHRPDVVIAATDGYTLPQDEQQLNELLRTQRPKDIFWLITSDGRISDDLPGMKYNLDTGNRIESSKTASF